ncbi:MAG: hypothetical protein ACXABO_20610 [Promethearchaeota archaeon]|jgi:hypothetical protein
MMVKATLKPKVKRARACIKCKEYVTIKPNDPMNIDFLKEFEEKHKSHSNITISVEEIKGIYQKMDKLAF